MRTVTGEMHYGLDEAATVKSNNENLREPLPVRDGRVTVKHIFRMRRLAMVRTFYTQKQVRGNATASHLRRSPFRMILGDTHEVEKMRRTMAFVSIFLFMLTVVSNVSAEPQRKGTSTLSGVVLGPDDKPVAHASVSYQSSGGNGAHVVRTNSQGRFSITKLRADNYDLRASGKGVFSEWEKNVNLRAGATKEVTLHLVYAKEIPKAYVKSNSKQ
jgi:Carboxypeptidase regulatory-like domain